MGKNKVETVITMQGKGMFKYSTVVNTVEDLKTSRIGKKHQKKFLKALRNTVEINRDHFIIDGWDLAFDGILDSVLEEFFGCDIQSIVLHKLITDLDLIAYREPDGHLMLRSKDDTDRTS